MPSSRIKTTAFWNYGPNTNNFAFEDEKKSNKKSDEYELKKNRVDKEIAASIQGPVH